MSNKHNYSQYSNKRRDAESGATAVQAAKPDKPKAEKPVTAAPAEVKMVVERSETAANAVRERSETAAKPESVAKSKPVIMEAPAAPVKPELVKETVETKALPKTVTGVVVNCSKLNVRAEPSLFADVVCVLDAENEIKIDVAQSNREWFKINTAIGAEGYCMRKFVNAYM